ncbi:MAG TPA: glycosyltransferase family 4 protein [Verrucomicrobiae bacterium]|nr:glycosyltransferase family 4 protein [Verrucomicrobiae bacterium]
MKAMVITPYYYPIIGGLENYARQLNRALHKSEAWEIVVVTATKPGQPSGTGRTDGQRVYRLKPWVVVSNTPLNPLWPFQIWRLKRREMPDVIIAHTPVPSMADAAALAAGKTPFFVVYHAASLLKPGSPIFNLLARLYRCVGWYTLHRAKHIFAVSDYVREQFSTRFQAKTTVVSNAVWPDEIQSRSQPAGGTHFVFIGSLDKSHSWKGLGHILQALAIYQACYQPGARLTVIGDGNHRRSYENQVKVLGLADSVTFVGAKQGIAKARLLASATALVAYPTTSNDAFPTVILEAWAHHVPVIGAAIGPLPSLLKNQVNGYLAPAADPAALAEAMRAVALAPRSQRANIARQAARRTRECYTWPQSAKQLGRSIGVVT